MSGFVERELAVARGLSACRGDDACLDEADAEIAELRGQAVVLRRLLADALAVLLAYGGKNEQEDTTRT